MKHSYIFNNSDEEDELWDIISETETNIQNEDGVDDANNTIQPILYYNKDSEDLLYMRKYVNVFVKDISYSSNNNQFTFSLYAITGVQDGNTWRYEKGYAPTFSYDVTGTIKVEMNGKDITDVTGTVTLVPGSSSGGTISGPKLIFTVNPKVITNDIFITYSYTLDTLTPSGPGLINNP